MRVNPEQHLIKDIDEGLVHRWTQYSTALNEGSEQRGEAQSFILRCVAALHRERQVSCHCADRHAVPIHTLNMIRITPFTPHDLITALDLSVNINIMIFWAVSGRNGEAWSRCVLRHVISTDMQHFPFALRYKTRVW